MEHRPEAVMIAMAWERAKGEMRAAVAAIGALPPIYPNDNLRERPSKFTLAKEDVEGFITAMESAERFDI